MKRRGAFVAMATAAVLVFTAGALYAADTIILGANYGMTGTMGWIGGDCVDGANLAIDQANKKGGIKGKQIELVMYDSKNDADTARTNFEKLVKRDKAIAILGPVSNQETETVLPLSDKNAIVYTAVSGGVQVNERILPEYKKEGKKCYLWALTVGTARQGEVFAVWAKKKGFKRLALIDPLDQMGDLSTATYEQYAKKYGLEVVAKERYDVKGTDFTTQMSKIKAANPDVIAGMPSGGPTVTIVKNRDQLGMSHIPFKVSDANLSKSFITLLGENTKNIYNVAAKIQIPPDYLKDSDSQKKVIMDFQKAFKTKFNKEPKSWFFASVGYDTALMYIKAMEAVGTNGAKMRDWIEKQKAFQGAQAVYSWSDTDHRGIGVEQCVVMMIKGDDWVPVD